MSETVYIGLGSNLGERGKQLSWAMTQLAETDQIKLIACSSFYETAPVGNIKSQPDFLNAVCQIETDLSARPLLDLLLELEKKSGRKRTDQLNEPRNLDLDLLLYGDTIIKTERLHVPHPRLHKRAFVMYPLLEIAPQLVIPDKGRLETLVKNVGTQQIKRLTGHWTRKSRCHGAQGCARVAKT